MLKIDTNHVPIFHDLRKGVTITSRLLKNQFDQDLISLENVKSISSSIIGKPSAGLDFDSARIEIDSDNMKKSLKFKVGKKGENFIFGEDNSPIVQVNTNSPFVAVMQRTVTSVPLCNNDNVEISFDKFKDIIFCLPFISDLIRASCGFNYSLHENFIKSLKSVRIEVSSIESSKVMHFNFTSGQRVKFVNNNYYNRMRTLTTNPE